MTIGPRDKPYPIILHVDSNTGNPSKLAESNAIYVSSVSAITLSATTVCATNWVGIPGGPGTTDHGQLTGLSDNDHPQYVLSATNSSLSSLVSDHLASAVHWDANTLDSRFINASGDSVTGSFYFGNLSAAVFSATTISATNAYIASTVQFDIGVVPTLSVGQMGWNSDDQTIDIQTTVDTTLQIGQEQVILVENKSGATIPNGKVVYVSGTTGGSGKLQVALAAASSTNSETAFIIGVATQTINDNSTGFVTTFGKVHGIPLPGFSNGDIAYLGDTPGELRSYKPSKPSHGSFQLGRVINAHPSNGILFVTIRGSVDMSEIHDVASSTPTNGQILVWNNASGFYEPNNVSAISGINNYATTASLNNYVVTSTNLALSNTVTGHLASAVHWDANTLDARFINASGDSVTGSYFFSNLSATNLSATSYLNLPSVTALNGTGVFEVTSYSRSNYVLTSTNLALSNTVTGHLASAVHWDANTLDARFINASGDSVTGSFTFGNVTGTNVCATTYLNLPSALATWNASALQGRAVNNAAPGVGEVLAWDDNNSRWTPSAVATGGITNNPGGSNTGNIQFKNGTAFSGVDALTYDSTLSSLYSRGLSSLSVTATNISATTYFNLPSVTALNGTGVFEVTSYSRSNYVLTSTNLALSNTVTGHLASAVHWDANTLDARFINASGDSVTGSFFFGNLSATNFSATSYSNLPSVTALNGTGVFEVTSYSRSNYVLTSTNLALSNAVTGHLASAVHWDANTLDARFINASGDSVTGAFTFGNVTGTNFSATTYFNLPSVTALNGTGVFEVTSYSRSNYVLTSTNLALSNTVTGHLASAVHWDQATLNANYINASGDSVTGAFTFGNVTGTNFSATTYLNLPSGTATWNANAIQGIAVCATAPTTTNQAFVYDSANTKWKPGYTIYQSTAIPSNGIGANGDIYLQYDQSSTLSGLSDVLVTATPTTNYVLKWNGSKWAPAQDQTGAGGGPAGANYQFQFYNDGAFSATKGMEFLYDYPSPGYRTLVISGTDPTLPYNATPTNLSVPYGSIYSPYVNTSNFGVYGPGGSQVSVNSTVANVLGIPSVSSASISSTLVSSTSSIANIYKNNVSILNATSIELPDTCNDKMFISCVSNTIVVLPNATANAGRSLQFIKSDTSGWPVTISSVYLNTPTSAVMVNIPRDVVSVISDGNCWYVETTRQVYGHNRFIYFDDFMTGNNESGGGEVGELRWAFTNGTLDWLTPTSTYQGGNYLGMMRRSSAATINQIATLTLDSTGARHNALTKDYLELRTRTALSGAVTSYKFRVGLIGSNTQFSGIPTEGIYFETSSGSNWLAVTVAAGAATITDTSFADVTGLHNLRIFRQESGNIEFYIDNELKAYHTTNIPNHFIGMSPCAQLVPLAASARSYVMDYYGFCVVNRSNLRNL